MSWFEVAVFFILGILAIGGALAMVLHRDPIRSALGLLLTMVSLGITYLLLSAAFVGFVQLVVYAGAIVVLFLLAIMNFPIGALNEDALRGWRWWSFALILFIGGTLQQTLLRFPLANRVQQVDGSPEGIGTVLVGTVAETGQVLFGSYIYIFQLAGLLLLVALIAAIFLTRENEPAEHYDLDPDELEALEA